MANKLRDGTYSCSICGTVHRNAAMADGCRDSHQILYIPMSKSELNRLLNALYNEDFDQIPVHLLETLKRYQQFNANKKD